MANKYRKKYQYYKKHYLEVFQSIYKKPSTRVSLGLALSFITVIFFGFVALKPTIITIINLLQEIKTKKVILQKLEQKVVALNQAQVAFAKAQESLSFIKKALPENSEFLKLEREIEFLSFKNNLILADVRFDRFALLEKVTEEKREKQPLDFKLTLAGTYEDLKNFLADLENLDRIIVLEKVDFSKETEVKGASLQIMITGSAYYIL